LKQTAHDSREVLQLADLPKAVDMSQWLYMDPSRFASIAPHQAVGSTAHVYPAC
jgi:hypothetical protein